MSFRDASVQGVTFSFKIADSVVSVDYDASDIDGVAFNLLHLFSYYYVRGILDAVSFAHAMPLTLILDMCTKANGERIPIRIEEPELSRLCTLSEADIIGLVEKERAILKHLHDLSCSLLNTLDTEANCAKAVEGFAQLLLPGEKAKQRWRQLQKDLNLTEAYVQFISELSTGPRHGTTDPQLMTQHCRDQAKIMDHRQSFLGVSQTRQYYTFRPRVSTSVRGSAAAIIDLLTLSRSSPGASQ
jgi:hypothetical protein